MTLSEKMLKCKRCKLRHTRTQVVIGRGAVKPRIVFIGEAPGYWEDKKGKPFIGNAGKILNKAIKNIGIRTSDYYITNLVKCRPTDANGNNRPPSDYEKDRCSYWLTKQIQKISPTVIITLGTHPTHHILGSKIKITKLAGRPKKFGTMFVFPLLHPASILHHPKYQSLWSKHLKLLKKFLEGLNIINLNNQQATLQMFGGK